MAGWWLGVTLLLLVVCSVSLSAASTLPSDVDALQGLLRAWQGTPGQLDTWSLDKDADPCESHWKGVRCCQAKTVVSLDLRNAGLVGTIPVEIGDLRNIRHLDLSGNPMLTGAIPKEISNLPQLTSLKLSGCDLSGEVPQELNSMSCRLKFMDLSNNPRLLSNEESQDFTTSSKFTSVIQQRSGSSSRRLLHHRTLLQAAPTNTPTATPTPAPVAPPPATPTPTNPLPAPPVSPPTSPPVSPPTSPPVSPPASPPIAPPILPPALPPAVPAPPTPVRTYLMWIGIGALCVVLLSVAIFWLCRKFGQQKIRGGQRLPPLPRYH